MGTSLLFPPDARPFLKWAGGKTQLLPELLAHIPAEFGRYHEPFVGSGALFFALRARGLAARASLSDANRPLIEAYKSIRDDVEGVIAALSAHKNEEERFYEVRGLDPATLPPAERAARILYLNRTCFNGLYRENRSGQFNVPFGRYANPRICDEVNLRAVARSLKGVSISLRGYARVRTVAKPGDLVYFDPPYQPVSTTSSFTAYDRHGFGEEDQRRLRDVFAELATRGVRVLLSNSDTPRVRELYAAFRLDRVWASRSINSRGDRRGKVAEVIVVAGPR
ncbi:MAG: DNA adenine methylase [Planctomycetota bacterium]